MMGFHSVIDRPLSVRRVIPPMTTIRNTIAATAISQLAMACGRRAGVASERGVSNVDSMQGRDMAGSKRLANMSEISAM